MLVRVGDPGGDEVPGTQRRLLLLRYALDHGRGRHAVAHSEVPVVLLLAVRRDNGGEACLVEDAKQIRHRRTGARTRVRRDHAAHDPGLEHRGRGDQLAVGRPGGSVGIHVDGIAVADRVAPVADHRRVHLVAGDDGLAGELALELAKPIEQRSLRGHGGHRFDLGSPSPVVAMISRCTSFTPPPNVSTNAAR